MERVNKAGAVFNVEKLDWLNGYHIRNKNNEDILQLFKSELGDSKYNQENYTDEFLLSIIEAMKERITFVKDLIENSSYFYTRPSSYDENIIKKRWKDDSVKLLSEYVNELLKVSGESKENFETTLKLVAEKNECGNGRLIHPIRLAVSGVGIGPGVYDLLVILGKNEVIERIKIALEEIPKLSDK